MRILKPILLISFLSFNLFPAVSAGEQESNIKNQESAEVIEIEIEERHERKWPIHFVASGRFGWDWAEVGKSQHVLLNDLDPAPDYFKATDDDSTRPVIGGFLGVELPIFSERLHWQTGVAYYQTRSFNTEGIEYPLSEADFGIWGYQYSLKNQRVMFENKLLYCVIPRVYGYVLGGVGAAFNKAYDFERTEMQEETPTDGFFDSHTKTSVSYSVGVGVEVAFLEHMRAGIGYQFSDLGKVSLGDFNNGNTDETISTSNTPTQELIMQLSFIF